MKLVSPIGGKDTPMTKTALNGWDVYQTTEAPEAFITLNKKSGQAVVGISDYGRDRMVTLFGKRGTPDFTAYDARGDGAISRIEFFDDNQLYTLTRINGRWQLVLGVTSKGKH
jgi:hypothetical protein